MIHHLDILVKQTQHVHRAIRVNLRIDDVYRSYITTRITVAKIGPQSWIFLKTRQNLKKPGVIKSQKPGVGISREGMIQSQ